MTSSLQLQYLQDLEQAENAFASIVGKIEQQVAESVLADLKLSTEAHAFVAALIFDEFTAGWADGISRTDGVWSRLQIERVRARKRFALDEPQMQAAK